MARHWRTLCVLAALGLCLGLAACQDHDTLPTEAATYTMTMNVTWSGPPYPQVGEVVLVVDRVTSSGTRPVADGVEVAFTTDPWRFDNGLQVVVVETVGGRAVAHLVADAPARAAVRARLEIDGIQLGAGTYFELD